MAAKRSFSLSESRRRRPNVRAPGPARDRAAVGAGAAQGQVRKNEARAVSRPPLAVLVSAARNLPELRKSIMRGNLRRQYRAAGRVAWAEGGEAHFRTKCGRRFIDFGDQICYVEVPRKIDPAEGRGAIFVLYGGGDDVLAAGGAHMADLGELKWLPLKRGSAAAAGKVRGGALHVRAYVASPADLKQLNAPPAPRAAQRVADPVKWAVATPSLLKQRYESALRSAASPADVAEDLKRYHATLLTAQSMGRPAGDGPERANAPMSSTSQVPTPAVAVAANRTARPSTGRRRPRRRRRARSPPEQAGIAGDQARTAPKAPRWRRRRGRPRLRVARRRRGVSPSSAASAAPRRRPACLFARPRHSRSMPLFAAAVEGGATLFVVWRQRGGVGVEAVAMEYVI